MWYDARLLSAGARKLSGAQNCASIEDNAAGNMLQWQMLRKTKTDWQKLWS